MHNFLCIQMRARVDKVNVLGCNKSVMSHINAVRTLVVSSINIFKNIMAVLHRSIFNKTEI